jgi:hypothetical protein
VSATHGREFNASCTWLQSLGSEVGVPLKERTKRIFAVFGAAWVAVWVLVLLTRTEASLAVRVGGATYLVAGLATLVLTASRRRQPRWLDWAICVAWAVGMCGAALCVTLAEAEWGPTVAGYGLFGVRGCLSVPFCPSTGLTRGVERPSNPPAKGTTRSQASAWPLMARVMACRMNQVA